MVNAEFGGANRVYYGQLENSEYKKNPCTFPSSQLNDFESIGLEKV